VEAIIANPIKAESEYRNRQVWLKGVATVGKDDKGSYVAFQTTAIAPGEVKPKPGIIAYIAKGEEPAFADLKRDATISVQGVIRSWKLDQPQAFQGVVIEMGETRLVTVAHSGY
jgi:hypothetical protein